MIQIENNTTNLLFFSAMLYYVVRILSEFKWSVFFFLYTSNQIFIRKCNNFLKILQNIRRLKNLNVITQLSKFNWSEKKKKAKTIRILFVCTTFSCVIGGRRAQAERSFGVGIKPTSAAGLRASFASRVGDGVGEFDAVKPNPEPEALGLLSYRC